MDQGIYGLNCRTMGASRDQIISAVVPLRSAFTLAQDDPALIAMLNAGGMRTIYRQSGDAPENDPLRLSAAEFMQPRLANGAQATYVHSYNELDPSSLLHTRTLEGMKLAEAAGKKLAIYNLSTNKSRAQWESCLDNIRYAALHGHAIGVHVYLDGQHNEGAYEWLAIKHAVGGTWICTEFGYIQTIFDAGRGWRGKLSEAEYASFLEQNAPFFTDERMPVCLFSYEHWPLGSEGRESGFGIQDATETLLPKLATLNQTYRLKDEDVTTYPAGTTPEQKKVNQPAGLRLRSLPSLNSITIRPMVFGEAVTVYAEPVVAIDGYSWQRVTDAYGNNGWAANAVSGRASFVDPSPVPPPAQAWIVNLPVPHVSQIDSDSRLSNNDCSLASLLMLLRHWFKQRGMGVPVLPTVDDLERHTVLADPIPPSGLTFAQIVTLAQQLCFPLTYLRPLNEIEIVRHLDAGRPVMALVGYAEFNPAAHESFNHFAVIIGHNDTEFNVHDPYKGGANYRVSRQRFMNAMQQVGDNLPNQGLVLQVS